MNSKESNLMWIRATGPPRVPFLNPPEAPPDKVSVKGVVPPDPPNPTVPQLPSSIQPKNRISPTSANSGNISPLTQNEISRYESAPICFQLYFHLKHLTATKMVQNRNDGIKIKLINNK
jgi:hypothetical protein